MKSSTIRRSTLSKESMEVIEALSKEQENANTIGEYVRPEEVEEAQLNKSSDINTTQEIDLLWQNFKSTQFNSNSPMAHALLGFFAGVITTLLILFSIGLISSKINGKSFSMPIMNSKLQVEIEQNVEQTDPVIEENEQIPSEQEATQQKAVTQTVEEQPEPKKLQDKKSESKIQEVKNDTAKMTKYVVKEGDTGEAIIKRHYGSYSPERAERIMKANNLSNLDRLQINQELLIPAE